MQNVLPQKIVLEVVRLSMAIQSKGIGEAIVYLSGHCGIVNIDIHCPKWESGDSAAYQYRIAHFDKEEEVTDTMAALRDLLERGDTKAAEREAEAKKARRLAFLELAKEFELEVA